MTSLNKAALVARYVAERDLLATIKTKYEAECLEHKQILEKIEKYFLALANEEGVESWRTDGGTVYLTRTESVRLADPEAFMEFVIANGAWDLIEKRASKTGVRGFVDSNDVLPPGAELSSRLEVNVRRPSAT